MGKTKLDMETFCSRLRGEGLSIRDLLWPLSGLSPRERAVFMEYHYWNTHMKVIARSHRISLGRAYEVLYRSEEKVAIARSQTKTQKDPHQCT